MSERITGTCKWWASVKGYGFLVREDGKGDVFCHYSAIESTDARKDLQEGDRVEFETTESDKGLKAVNVRKI
jgi:Cold shock proteins